jgi:hypothetical protein
MPRKTKVINPLTGRKITVGGATYRRVHSQLGGAPTKSAKPVTAASAPNPQKTEAQMEMDNIRRFDTDVLRQQSEKFFDQLVNKSVLHTSKPVPTKLGASTEDEPPVIPKNKHALIGSNLPPAPPQTHSYYHHHAPFAQDFGSYVCLKKDTLRDLGMFLRDSMFTSVT